MSRVTRHFMAHSTQNITIARPAPILGEVEVFPFSRHTDLNLALENLNAGHYVLITDYYSSGLLLLNALKKTHTGITGAVTFQEQRAARAVFQERSNRVLLVIRNQQLVVRKSPQIGWLKKLYPELDEFLLPFPQVQGLNSAWQWYVNGLSIPVLPKKIHPWYGTYFPTRFEHLLLFDDWLSRYSGSKYTALDIGIGSGILSYQLLNHGFKKIFGTDSNPNAIVGMLEAIGNSEQNLSIELFFGDLFAGCTESVSLIVFNPPWLPATYKSEGIDSAMYYDETLFPRFFTEAASHLLPGGRLVLLFSNLAQLTFPGTIHPIEAELLTNKRFKKELFLQKKVSQASSKTRRNQNMRSAEMVELWVLKGL